MKHKTIKKYQQQAAKTQKNSQKRNKTETTQKRNDKNAKKYRRERKNEKTQKKYRGECYPPPFPPRLKTGGGKVKR